MDDREVYRLVAEEIQNGRIDQGLWTQALAKFNYDKNKAKAYYLKQRSKELGKEISQQIKLEEYRRLQENTERQKRIDLEREETKRRKIDILLNKSKALDRLRKKRTIVYYGIPTLLSTAAFINAYRSVLFSDIPPPSFIEGYDFVESISALSGIFLLSSFLSIVLVFFLFISLRKRENLIIKDLAEIDKEEANKVKKKRRPILAYTAIFISFIIFLFSIETIKQYPIGEYHVQQALWSIEKGEDPTKHAQSAIQNGNFFGSLILGELAFNKNDYDSAFKHYGSVKNLSHFYWR